MSINPGKCWTDPGLGIEGLRCAGKRRSVTKVARAVLLLEELGHSVYTEISSFWTFLAIQNVYFVTERPQRPLKRSRKYCNDRKTNFLMQLKFCCSLSSSWARRYPTIRTSPEWLAEDAYVLGKPIVLLVYPAILIRFARAMVDWQVSYGQTNWYFCVGPSPGARYDVTSIYYPFRTAPEEPHSPGSEFWQFPTFFTKKSWTRYIQSDLAL